VFAADVRSLPIAVQCTQDLTTPVFYACGSRLFKCQTIFDVNLDNNDIVRYGAGDCPFAENDNVTDRSPVSDRICPYCSQIVASSVSQMEYERHVQAHLDSDDDDDDDVIS